MASAPHSKLIKGKAGISKIKCDGCGNLVRVRHVIKFKGRFLCTNCKFKLETSRLQQSASSIGIPKISLEDALNRIYEVKFYRDKKNKPHNFIQFPICLANKKIKIKLIEG